jgi:hypothetical protein
LTITETIKENRAVYAPRSGDSYVLTVEMYSGRNNTVLLTCSGNVQNSSGIALTFQLSVNNTPLSITIENGHMTVINGVIVSDNGEAKIAINEPKTLMPVIDKANLKAALDAANTAKNGITASLNGRNVLRTAYWVTTEQMNIFTSTISSVQAIYDNKETNQAIVDLATATLLTAISIFDGKKKAGSKTEDS